MPQIQFQRPKPSCPVPAIKAADYLQILFNDLNYDRLHRNDKLSAELQREIKFLDELTDSEVRRMITILREQKYGALELKESQEFSKTG